VGAGYRTGELFYYIVSVLFFNNNAILFALLQLLLTKKNLQLILPSVLTSAFDLMTGGLPL